MPKLSPKTLPKYRKHRPSGRAVVTLDGNYFYLGPYGSKVSRAEYDRVVGEWQANGRKLPTQGAADISINELMLAYVQFVEAYYRKPDGTPTTEVANIRYALKPLSERVGS